MIQDPAIVVTKERAAAVIHMVAPDMPKLMPPAIQDLLTVMARQGLAPQGPMFAHHLRMPTEVFDLEVGFPIAGKLAASGRVKAGVLPAAIVARTIYYGPYEGLGAAWSAFSSTLQTEGILEAVSLRPAGGFWEACLVGPESIGDASEYQTELNLRLSKA